MGEPTRRTENTLKGATLETFLTFEIFDQSDEETCDLTKQKTSAKTKTIRKTKIRPY